MSCIIGREGNGEPWTIHSLKLKFYHVRNFYGFGLKRLHFPFNVNLTMLSHIVEWWKIPTPLAYNGNSSRK